MKPLLVFIHGFTGRATNFERVGRQLPDDVEVIGLEVLGHNGQPIGDDAPRSFDGEVDRLLAACPPGAARPRHLVGYSMGGRLALGMLARDPDGFTSATLIGVHPGLATAAERAQRQASDEAWCRILEARGLEAFVDAWQAQPLFRSQQLLPPGRTREQRRQRLAHHPMALAYALRTLGLSRMPNLRPLLNRIPIPVSVMAGQLDTKFSVLACEMVNHLPNGRFVSVPSAGHNIVLERPGFLAETLRPVVMPVNSHP